MSAIQEIAPHIEAYQGRVKQAKEAKHLTIQELSDRSGVSQSVVTKLMAGIQNDPKLYNSVALCKVLELSIDEMFGLDKPIGTNEGLQRRIHELEVENARLKTVNEMQAEGLQARKPVIFALMALCTILSCALVAYLIIDSTIRDAGLILWGNLSPHAWGLVGTVAVSALFIAYLLFKAFRKKL